MMFSATPAQDARALAEKSIALRFQLLEVETQIEPLLLRSQELLQLLKPESADRLLGFSGATKPEDICAQLRKRLQDESERVQVKINFLNARRAQLQSTINTADVTCVSCGWSSNAEPSIDQIDRLKALALVSDAEVNLQLKIGEAEARLAQLDYDLKPENIARALVGTGSARPEELRDERRRLLSLERAAVIAKLGLLKEIQSRLETLRTSRI